MSPRHLVRCVSFPLTVRCNRGHFVGPLFRHNSGGQLCNRLKLCPHFPAHTIRNDLWMALDFGQREYEHE